MGDLSLRDVDDELIRLLGDQARRNGRSPESEHQDILRRALIWGALEKDSDKWSWEERAALMRRLTSKRQQTPSELLLREDRDSR